MSKRHHAFAATILILCGLGAASSTAGYSGSLDTTLKVTNTGSGKAIVATGGSNIGLQGVSTDSYGVWASSDNGAAIGAQGYTHGVYANAGNGYGVWAGGLVGVSGYSTAYDGIGLSGVSVSGGGVKKGVNAYASSGDVAYGIYATGTGATQNWAGYFSGNVHVTGSLSWVSDARFKKNVRPMTDGLEKVMALRPKTYEMKVDEYKGRLQLAEGGQYGLIAEEVEAVLPDLVMPVTASFGTDAADGAKRPRGDAERLEYKSVNYAALIPILVEAVQEQQKLIREQQARIEALEAAR